MPDRESERIKPLLPKYIRATNQKTFPEYSELQVTSNFSFLRGASHPEELVSQAAILGYRGVAITDHNSLAGIVRAHIVAKSYSIQYIVGSRLELKLNETQTISILVYPENIQGYKYLCRLLTLGKIRVEKDLTHLTLEDFLPYQKNLIIVIVPAFTTHDYVPSSDVNFLNICRTIKENSFANEQVYLAVSKTYRNDWDLHFAETLKLSKSIQVPLVVTNDVYYHIPHRRILQDIITCIRHGCPINQAGFKLLQNSERHLKSPSEMHRMFKDLPSALKNTIVITERVSYFSLDELRYEYPKEIYPNNLEPLDYINVLIEEGKEERFPNGVPNKVLQQIEEELILISELKYEKYFLTCYDIVKFARSKGILAQGRGAAANSVVCYLLGITAVDPSKVDLLFARFVSKERDEPPDIDIDFEHERREEVIQYIYSKYGREHAGLTAVVVTYRERSAIRDVGKALGLSIDVVDRLAKAIHRWTNCEISKKDFDEVGIDPMNPAIKLLLRLTEELLGFPRHISQHCGGFIISNEPLCELVPILNARMPHRTIIEWDKNDIDALGMLKIDILALGMLTCIRKALELVNKCRNNTGESEIALYSIPPDDRKTYDMICKADTVGVFQIESRAQMSMLPRLKPNCFYDLIIEVAIVRPGPIVGNMVHPYLKRRNGIEQPYYPDERVRGILGKTLGVPIFQEQAMRLAIVLAGFSPGEAEQLRRAMAAWKRNEGIIAAFKERIVQGMTSNGYTVEFAETCMSQLRGFAEYGFPESHAASFALIVYASCWIKCHYPAQFMCSLLNSQPMGFYQPSQIIADALSHNVKVTPIDINDSDFDCTMQTDNIVSIGMRFVRGIQEEQAKLICNERIESGSFKNIFDLWKRVQPKGVHKHSLTALAKSDAFASFGKSVREALWEIQRLPKDLHPIEVITEKQEDFLQLPEQPLEELMYQDYRQTGFSLKAHPLEFVRNHLSTLGVKTSKQLREIQSSRQKTFVSVAGLAIIMQRPGTAKGVVFITLEDETGVTNLLIHPKLFDEANRAIMTSKALLAYGLLEKIGEVVYITAKKIECVDLKVFENKPVALPSKSYSY
jgi:error-prone DNA polymerase